MTKSIYRSWANNEEIASRVDTAWMNVFGILVVERASEMRDERRVAV
jgi:hypothetical protein